MTWWRLSRAFRSCVWSGAESIFGVFSDQVVSIFTVSNDNAIARSVFFTNCLKWNVHIVTIYQHIVIMLHTILVSTRNFVTARPRNNIFYCCHIFKEKAKVSEFPFWTKEIGKEITRKLFSQGYGSQRLWRHSTTTKSHSSSCAWQFCGSLTNWRQFFMRLSCYWS